MRGVKRINPIYLLIALNVLMLLLRVILPEPVTAALGSAVESTLAWLGPFAYAGIVVFYGICGFFFIPLLIPLNILGGALYGAWTGTAVALAGITFSTFTSTISQRHVFTGMQQSVEGRPGLQRLLAGVDRYRNLVVVMVRFAVIIPYQVQNIALAATSVSLTRLTLLTAVSALPGAAIYSLLGAGLVESADIWQLLLYIALPIALLLVLTGAVAWFKSRLDRPEV